MKVVDMVTKEILNSQLAEFGIEVGKWVALEKVIPVIFLSQDSNNYPSDSSSRYRFNSNLELLEIAYGSTTDGTFISRHGEISNFTPDAFIDYGLIGGFIKSLERGPMGNYYHRFNG